MHKQPSAKQIFLDALEQPQAQRGQFIDRCCNGDDALRTRVTALLSAHQETAELLDSKPVLPAAALEELVAPPRSKQIENYHLIRVLGRGGFGVVWLAEQREPLRRNVALKLLHPALTGFGAYPAAAAEVLARFEAERQALASMDHPNIARVIDAGTVRHGPHADQPFFAMEYVEGPSITKYCDDHALDLDARIELFIQMCAGVQHAHQKGLIHRDLKPGNVLIATVDGRPTPKVIDFGVSKAIGEIAPPAALTQQSAVIGTPQYMSPEQAQLNGAAVDTRSDVYSLGAVLYELLTGSPPIAAETVRGLPVQEICRMVRETSPPTPSARMASKARAPAPAARRLHEPARLASRLRGELDWITLKALAKDPQQRYQSPAELAADLRRHLDHQPIFAGPPSRIYRARKFFRRHRAGVLMTAAAAAMLIAATAVSLAQAAKARRAEAEAKAQADQARHEASKFLAMARFSQGILRSIDPAIARDRDRTLMREVLDAASKRTENDPDIDREVAVPILSTLGYAYAALGETEKAIYHYREAYGCAQQLFGSDHSDALKEAQNLFAALVESGEYAEAEKIGPELRAAFERAGLADSGDALAFYTNFGVMYFKQGKPREALPLFKRAAEGRGKSQAGDDPETFPALNNLAAVYFRLDDLEQARDIWNKLLAIQQAKLGEDHPQTLSTLNNLGMLAEKMKDFATAEAHLKKVLAGKRKVLPAAHPSLLMTEVNLGTLYLDQKNYAEALAILEPSHATAAAKFKDEDERRLMLAVRLVNALRGAGRVADADELSAATRLAIAKLPPDHSIHEEFAEFAGP